MEKRNKKSCFEVKHSSDTVLYNGKGKNEKRMKKAHSTRGSRLVSGQHLKEKDRREERKRRKGKRYTLLTQKGRLA